MPRRPKRRDLFPDRGRGNIEPGPAFDVPLQVGLAQTFEREFLAEGGDQVLEVDAVGVERAFLAARRPRRKVAVAERVQGQRLAAGTGRGGGCGRLAVVLDEFGDVDARGAVRSALA